MHSRWVQLMRLINHAEEKCLNLTSTQGNNENVKYVSVARFNNKRKEQKKKKQGEEAPEHYCDAIFQLCDDHSEVINPQATDISAFR